MDYTHVKLFTVTVKTRKCGKSHVHVSAGRHAWPPLKVKNKMKRAKNNSKEVSQA